MYSLLFVSFFNWELVKKAQADQEEEEKAWEEMLRKFQKEREAQRKSQVDRKSLTKQEMKEMLAARFERFQVNYFDKLDGMDEFGESESEKPDERKRKLQELISGHGLQRADYLAQCIFVFLVQILLVILLMTELISSYETTLAVYPPTYWVIISRFVCGIVLHMQLQDELKQGLSKMKFAVNHSYKFKPGLGFQVAFFSGLM